MSVWSLRDEAGNSVLYYANNKSFTEDDVKFFCKEMKRHGFMIGHIMYWELPPVDEQNRGS